MKKILLIISFFTISVGYAQDWEFFFESDKGKIYYKPNTDETAWLKFVSEKTQYYPSETSLDIKTVDGYTVCLWKFDCSSKKTAIIKLITYSKKGQILNSISQNELLVEMEYANPDSLDEDLLQLFCKLQE